MDRFKPILIIPSYNTGRALLRKTIDAALETGIDLMLVVDGSTDGSDHGLEAVTGAAERLQVIRKTENSGKGHSILLAAEEALKNKYTHALVMDSDGQHPAKAVNPMLDLAHNNSSSIIMGQPLFGNEAPKARVYGRKLTTLWTNIETLWCGLGDTLFGFRVYPLDPLIKAFGQTSFARGFDFDPEIAVRMTWLGCRPVQYDVPVCYLSADEGGVSHFHYLRDNFKLTLLHFRLVPEFLLLRLIPFIRLKRQWKKVST